MNQNGVNCIEINKTSTTWEMENIHLRKEIINKYIQNGKKKRWLWCASANWMARARPHSDDRRYRWVSDQNRNGAKFIHRSICSTITPYQKVIKMLNRLIASAKKGNFRNFRYIHKIYVSNFWCGHAIRRHIPFYQWINKAFAYLHRIRPHLITRDIPACT